MRRVQAAGLLRVRFIKIGKAAVGRGDMLAEDNGRGKGGESGVDEHLIRPFGAPDPAQAALCSSGKLFSGF